jgi:hypothetical protein
MNKEFIPYDLALRMKALDYNEECLAYYNLQLQIEFKSCYNKVPIIMSGKKCGIPTFSQAFRWFREKYDLWSCIQKYPTSENPNRCYYELKGDNINTDKDESPNSYMSGWFNSYEEAEIACLTKLIEIVEQK